MAEYDLPPDIERSVTLRRLRTLKKVAGLNGFVGPGRTPAGWIYI